MKKERQKMTPLEFQEYLEEVKRVQRKEDIAFKIMLIALGVVIVGDIIWLIILLS
mgnify:FL=1